MTVDEETGQRGKQKKNTLETQRRQVTRRGVNVKCPFLVGPPSSSHRACDTGPANMASHAPLVVTGPEVSTRSKSRLLPATSAVQVGLCPVSEKPSPQPFCGFDNSAYKGLTPLLSLAWNLLSSSSAPLPPSASKNELQLDTSQSVSQ